MKRSKKLLCLLMTAVMVLMSTLPAFAEGEPTDLPASDQPMIENTTDSSNMEGYSESDVHGYVDNPDADVVESLISDEARVRFAEAVDRIDAFEPVQDEEVALVLGRVESFLSGGNLDSYLQSGDLQLGADIGLTTNKTDKVKVLGTESNASGWVYVVDQDATCFVAMDKDGMGIPKAQVTLSYVDENGKRITTSITATDGKTPGIAVFDEMPETTYAVVDIQAEGYHAVSVLDKLVKHGDHYTYVLEEAEANELYIRGVDLSGKDLVNEETDLQLINGNTGDLTLKVLVTKIGSASFPDSIEIYADNRRSTVLKISETAGYTYDSNTKVYTATKRWVEQGAGLLQEGDILSVKYGSKVFGLDHITVENAVTAPRLGNTNVPINTKPMPGDISDRLGGAGWINLTAQILQVPVTVGVFPDGSAIFMASYDITQLDKNTQYKFSDLFQKSWNPKFKDGLEDPLQVFEKSFWENAEKVKKGDQILNSPSKVKCVSNKTYDINLSFSLYLRSCYNKDTDDSYGCGGFMFNAGFKGGITEYFLFMAGPVAIPVYIGFEIGFSFNLGISVNFAMDEPPAGPEGRDAKWRYTADEGWDLNMRIEFIFNFSVFGGVGVKGVLGACATGFATFDFATVLGKGKASIFNAEPHCFVDVLYGLRVEWYLLFFSGIIKIEALSGAERLWDSTGEKDKLTEADLDIEFTDISLADCEVSASPLVGEGPGAADEAFTLQAAGSAAGLGSSTRQIDSYGYPDSQVQIVDTGYDTVLFRLVSMGDRTHIIYQHLDQKTGIFSPVFYMIPYPEGETRSISEFVVVPNKTDRSDPRYSDKVYIGAILVDNTLEDEDARMQSTDVAAIVVDTNLRRTDSFVIASNPELKGTHIFSAPQPAGREDYCSVVYAATRLNDDNGTSINSIKELLTLTPGYTTYHLSYCDANEPGTRYHKQLGSEKVYSTGAIAPNEPSYWCADIYRSSDKWLCLKGYGANGYYAEDLRCNVRIDIEGMIDPADIAAGTMNFNSIITNWQYVNGCSYFIAGDSVYYMDKKPSGSSYEWEASKVKNGSGVVSVDNRYSMITNQDQSAVYIIGVLTDYDVDMEAGTSAKAHNRAQIYTVTRDIIYDSEGAREEVTLHGPLELKFAEGVEIGCYTALFNSNASAVSGLSIVYTKPSEDRKSAGVFMWQQNADRGLLPTEVKIPNYLVSEGQPYIEVYVTSRNYGYAREQLIPYTVTDETGKTLLQVVNGQSVVQHFYDGAIMYTGDTRVDKLLVKPNPEWTLKEEHEIIVDILSPYKYNGEIDEVVNSARVSADNISLDAKNILIGGKHYVSTTITNNTLIGGKASGIKVKLDYAEPRRGENELRFSLPTNDLIYRFDEEAEDIVDLVYHFDIDMDSIWEDGLKNGLRGAYFMLVDADGNQMSNEYVYLLNPAETRPDTIVGTKTDENGDPLEGAEISLFAAGSGEAVDTAESDENGAFTFYNVKAGEYTVRETGAPEGYVLSGKEYTVSAAGEGKTIEITITNTLIKGDVELTLTDEDDAEKLLSGAEFTVWSGDEQVGTLTETSDGKYTLSSLPYGEYTVKMETAPEGYESAGPWTVKIEEDGKAVLIDASAKARQGEDPVDPVDPPEPDEPDDPVPPKTGDDSKPWLWGGAALASLLVIAFIVVRARKKD